MKLCAYFSSIHIYKSLKTKVYYIDIKRSFYKVFFQINNLIWHSRCIIILTTKIHFIRLNHNCRIWIEVWLTKFNIYSLPDVRGNVKLYHIRNIIMISRPWSFDISYIIFWEWIQKLYLYEMKFKIKLYGVYEHVFFI